jgi:hypothetical protein
MSKNTQFIIILGICLLGLCAILGTAIITGSPGVPGNDDHINAINKTLVGMNITYYNFAGKPMNYTISPDDIGSVEKIEYNGQPAWKVHVGQGLAWDITMDAGGKQILDTKQLFQT